VSWQILQSDVTNPLPLKDNSVQCVVTSPPYWGLRDYGTASWAGGDAGCDHAHFLGGNGDASLKQVSNNGTQKYQYRDTCRKCGATRIDRQLGLEATPELYVEHMVAVFREVKRVLRDDGVCFLNLGSSYAGSMKGWSPNGYSYGGPKQRTNAGSMGLPPAFVGGRRPSRSLDDAPACGSDDKESESYPATGYACSDLCDECSHVLLNCTSSNGHQQPEQSVSPVSQTDRDNEPLDCEPSPALLPPVSSQESTQQQSLPPLQGECSHCANCGVCLNVIASKTRDASLCARKRAYPYEQDSSLDGAQDFVAGQGNNRGTGATDGASVSHTSGKASYSSSLVYLLKSLRHFKPKDLVNIPFFVAEALRLDGWYLRSDIIWSKPNPMPESVTDRPTKAHEYIFLLAKSPNYYFDQDAVREQYEPASIARSKYALQDIRTGVVGQRWEAGPRGVPTREFPEPNPAGRNIRTVWEIATQPYPEAHFAVFPEAIAERCIKAGTSEKGACSVCGAPWDRVTESTRTFQSGSGRSGNPINGKQSPVQGAGYGDVRLGPTIETKTLGWQPTCTHDAPITPCVVLDPFSGAGTTALVADKLGRFGIGLELKLDYCQMASRRCYDDAPLLSLLG
jgi:DNA modification methylase